MNKSEGFIKDILSRYINRENIEKAPAGFTDRIMTLIQLEEKPYLSRNHFLRNYKVPLISGLITVVLIVLAVTTSSGDDYSAITLIMKTLDDLLKTLPLISFKKLAGFAFPGWMIYIALGIVMLSLFDRVLKTLFHRDKK